MNRTRLAIWWLLSSAVVAGVTAWAVLRWHVAHEHTEGAPDSHASSLIDSGERFHTWLHGNLKLSAAQIAALEAAETAFAARRKELRDAMGAANASLRAAITRDKTNSPAVQTALNELAAAQAALQKATLAHLFEMAVPLDAPERDKLVQWTHDSLQPHP